MKYNDSLELIGTTPIIHLKNLSKKYNKNIYLKLEKYNLTGSIKDRAYKSMLLQALKENIINKDSTIIEASSGNAGISLAAICCYLKLKCIIVMPSDSNIERIKLIKAYNGNVILTDKNKKMKGCIEKVKKLLKEKDNSFCLNQFNNKYNYLSHYNTAIEIINDVNDVDEIYLSYGSAGSINGISNKIKELKKNVRINAIIPKNKSHQITGVYSNIKPINLLNSKIDNIYKITDYEVFKLIKEVIESDAIAIGLSSALALCGAIKYGKGNIVVICPDGLERYLSNPYLYFNYDYSENVIRQDLYKIYDYLFYGKEISDKYILYKYYLNDTNIKKIKKLLLLDAFSMYSNDPSCNSVDEVIDASLPFYAIFSYRIANNVYKENIKVAKIISKIAFSKTSIDIHPMAKIGKSFSIDHGCGIVIGQRSEIGDNVRMYQNVTLGAISLHNPSSLKGKKRHPTIKNNVIIYAGATILGGKTIIGNNVVIGSNVTITHSIKDNTKIFKNNNDLKEKYYDI